jgi:hypothetical protein
VQSASALMTNNTTNPNYATPLALILALVLGYYFFLRSAPDHAVEEREPELPPTWVDSARDAAEEVAVRAVEVGQMIVDVRCFDEEVPHQE